MREVELHVGRIFLEFLQQLLGGRTHYIVDLVDLVQLIVAGEEGEETEDLEDDAADSPYVHLVTIVTVGEQTLGGAVPSGGDVLGVRLLGIDAAARTEIGELHLVVL